MGLLPQYRMTTRQRKIIHIDADCFYAAVEMRDNPSLRDVPIAIGGSAARGVVATCNYPARKYGVRSAMPSSRATALCPQLQFIKPRMDVYHDCGLRMRAIFKSFSPLVEPLSLDEAYIDVSECEQHKGSATLIAQAIREKVFSELGITVSAGVAPNKFLAKVASDWEKPNGLTVIRPNEVEAFVKALPIKRLFGVGKVTAAKIEAMGVTNCEQLRQLSEQTLTDKFGVFGLRLHALCRGIDERDVSPNRRRKSLSVETTFAHDIDEPEQCHERISELYPKFVQRLEKLDDSYVPIKAVVKIKFEDFSQTTIERDLSDDVLTQFYSLFDEAYMRQLLPVRLVGIGVRFRDVLAAGDVPQLALEM